jgi:hypothetical protein
VRIAPNPDVGGWARACVPVREGGVLLGFVWILDEPPLSEGRAARGHRRPPRAGPRARDGAAGRRTPAGRPRATRSRDCSPRARGRLRAPSPRAGCASSEHCAKAPWPPPRCCRRAEAPTSWTPSAAGCPPARPSRGPSAVSSSPRGRARRAGRAPGGRARPRALAPDGRGRRRRGRGARGRPRERGPGLARAWTARPAARRRPRGAPRARSARSPSWPPSPATIPEAARREPAALRAVRAAPDGAELSATLLAFLDAGGDAARAADDLRVHRATLYRRLRRAEALGDLDLADGRSRLELHAALLLARLRG